MQMKRNNYDISLSNRSAKIIRNDDNNLISEIIAINKLFDEFGIEIGYYTSFSIVQQIIGENKYFINQNTTFYFTGNGSISSVFNFESDTSTTIFNIGENYSSPINQCQGVQYFGKSGAISINVQTSNIRKCTVLFNVVYYF
jgi:hypothetical protein